MFSSRRTPTRIRGRIGSALFALVFAAFLLPVAIAAPATAAEAETIHSLLNQARWDNGQHGLIRNSAMDTVALNWAREMAASGTLSHNPNYSDQIPAGWNRSGENVAQGYRTAASMHDGWMSSAGHRKNILGSFTDVGIAFYESGGTTWGVQVFANYAGHVGPAAPAPAPAPAPEPEAKPSKESTPSTTPTSTSSANADPLGDASNSPTPTASAGHADSSASSDGSPAQKSNGGDELAALWILWPVFSGMVLLSAAVWFLLWRLSSRQ